MGGEWRPVTILQDDIKLVNYDKIEAQSRNVVLSTEILICLTA